MTCNLVIDGAMGHWSAIAIAITSAIAIVTVQSWSHEVYITSLVDGTGQEREHDHQEHMDMSHHAQRRAQ